MNKDSYILDAPCGYGRHSIGLLGKGFTHIHGLDINEEFIDRIKRKTTLNDQFVVCELNSIIFPENYFNVVINMFHSFGFYEVEEQNLKVLKEIYRVLKPGGKFLMHTDVNIPYIKANPEYLSSFRTLKNGGTLEVKEKYNEKTKRVNGYWKIEKDNQISKNSYSMRVYGKDEFSHLCQKVGFSDIKSYGSFDEDTSYSENKPEMIIVGRKA